MSSIPLAFNLHTALTSGVQKQALVILHGLFGSSRNWRSVGDAINKNNGIPVYSVDLRNHGQTFREQGAHSMTWETMAADLRAFVESIKHENIALMGHSLGGQVIMQAQFSGLCPPSVKKLIVVDVAPRPIKFIDSDTYTLLQRMIELEALGLSSRSAAQKFMAEIEPNVSVVQFLLSNGTMQEGKFKFNLPLSQLQDGMTKLQEKYGDPSLQMACKIPTLFVKGGKSDSIRDPEDHELIRRLFSNPRIQVLEKSGHWPHHDSPEEFCRIVSQFLQSDSNIS